MITRLLNIVLRVALLAALFASVALFVDYRSGAAGVICAAGGGCGAVKASAFSHLGGVPVPVIGVGVFLGLLLSAIWASETRHLRWLALQCGVTALGALGFIGLQLFWIKAICPWCMVVDVAALVAALTALLLLRRDADDEPTWLRFCWAGIGVAVLALPLLWPINEMATPRVVTQAQRPSRVNLISFTDFQCPHCRALHKVIVGIEEQHGDKLHVARLMRPLKGHKGAKPAALAYLCMPEDKQPAFADQLYDLKPRMMTPSYIKGLAVAAGVDAKSYDACVQDPAQQTRIDTLKDAFRGAGLKGIPATFVESHFIGGAREDKLRAAVTRALAGDVGGGNLGWMIALMASLLGAGAALSMWQRQRHHSLFALTLALLLLGGCTKQKECDAAIEQINASAKRLETIADQVGPNSDLDQTAEMSAALAKAANEEAANLAELTITTEELKGDYAAYLTMVEDAAKAADKLATAARAADGLMSKLETSEKSMDAAMSALKKACAKGQPDCADIGEVLNKSPNEPTEAKLAAAMRTWVKQMDAIEPKDAAVKQALADVKKVITAQADFMEQAQKVQDDAEAAAKQLDDAVAPEDKLIDAMNKTCGAG